MSELDELSKKIAAAKQSRKVSPENMDSGDAETKKEMSFGMRVGVELFAGILVGSGLGYAIDYFANTLPLFLIIFMIVGAFAGFWNIYKSFMAGSK